MKDYTLIGHPHKYPFRKRCGWCGVQLRRWQRDLCRLCKGHLHDPWATAPCAQGSRWDAYPDSWDTETGRPAAATPGGDE